MMKQDLFYKRIREYFTEEEFQKLSKLLEMEHTKAIFLNTLKDTKENILNMLDFEVKKSDFTDDSYYIDIDNIGKRIANDLGLIYPQEISASIPAHVLNPQKGLIVDMCSAPGGKSINIANLACDDAYIISNEYDYKRSLILASNIERLGISNMTITNKSGDELEKDLYHLADYVLLDAPCSGEGMIRKDRTILDNYNLSNIDISVKRQQALLDNAYNILKNEGYLVYSTCTYAKEENEDNVNYILNKYPNLKLIMIDDKYPRRGIDMPQAIRFTPLENTEGQFCALFKKSSCHDNGKIKYLKTIKNKIVENFIADQLDIDEYYLYLQNDVYYISLKPIYDLGKKVIRCAIQLGELKKNVFFPSHTFYRANIFKNKYKKIIELNDEDYFKYRQGLSIFKDVEDGYYALFYKGYQFAFTKVSKKECKNKFPKGLRY